MKTWEKPKLIVITRSKPEETVLQTCKWPLEILGGPETVHVSCNINCTHACYDWSAS